MSGFGELTEYAGRAILKYGDEVSYESERDYSYEFNAGVASVNGSYKRREIVKQKVTIKRNGQTSKDRRH